MSRKPYKSDLTDSEWGIIQPLMPPPKRGGHPRTVDMREVINGVFYVLKTGCSWEMLPNDLPPSSTVYSYFRLFQRKGVWQEINLKLRRKVRHQLNRNQKPSAVSVDSQSIKTTSKSGATPARFPRYGNAHQDRGMCMASTEEKRSREENVNTAIGYTS